MLKVNAKLLLVIYKCTKPSRVCGILLSLSLNFLPLLFRVQFGTKTFDFLTLAFHFAHLRFEVFVVLTVKGGGKVFGSERHGKGRLVAEARFVVHVFEERRLDDKLLSV